MPSQHRVGDIIGRSALPLGGPHHCGLLRWLLQLLAVRPIDRSHMAGFTFAALALFATTACSKKEVSHGDFSVAPCRPSISGPWCRLFRSTSHSPRRSRSTMNAVMQRRRRCSTRTSSASRTTRMDITCSASQRGKRATCRARARCDSDARARWKAARRASRVATVAERRAQSH